MSKEELKSKLEELRRSLMKDNTQIAAGTVPKSPGQVKTTKKLIARIKSNLRKISTNEKKKLASVEVKIGPLIIDVDKFVVKIDGRQKFFPRKEFQLLHYLASNPGKVLNRDTLLKEIWGNDVYVIDRTIDVHIRKIREKLGKHSELIETVKGIGYRFKNIE